jgi:hypothetical protein
MALRLPTWRRILLRRCSVRRHRSEIMLGVLVVVFGPNQVARLGLSLGQREISLIASLCVLRTLQVRTGDIRCPLLRAVSEWPPRPGALRTRHCFWAILHGSLLGTCRCKFAPCDRESERAEFSLPLIVSELHYSKWEAVSEKALTISGADRFTRRVDGSGLHAISMNQLCIIWGCQEELSSTAEFRQLRLPWPMRSVVTVSRWDHRPLPFFAPADTRSAQAPGIVRRSL